MEGVRIKNVSSCPDYINQFIQTNMEKLMEIYSTEYKNNNNEGSLHLICNEDTNKMDVMFLNKENIMNIINSECWENIKLNIPEGKKLFIVKDEKLNSIFLLYI